MIKRILIFFLALQLVVIAGVVWIFAKGSGGKLNWAQEAWKRMNDDAIQHCFDVVKESGAFASVPSVTLLSGEASGKAVTVHYRIAQPEGRFQERVYECRLEKGQVDKTEERKRMLSGNFADINTLLQ